LHLREGNGLQSILLNLIQHANQDIEKIGASPVGAARAAVVKEQDVCRREVFHQPAIDAVRIRLDCVESSPRP
jgi:hypothetical protein